MKTIRIKPNDKSVSPLGRLFLPLHARTFVEAGSTDVEFGDDRMVLDDLTRRAAFHHLAPKYTDGNAGCHETMERACLTAAKAFAQAAGFEVPTKEQYRALIRANDSGQKMFMRHEALKG